MLNKLLKNSVAKKKFFFLVPVANSGASEAERQRRQTTTSVASSIVVKYTNGDDRHSRASSLAESVQSSQMRGARKLTPDELTSESSSEDEDEEERRKAPRQQQQQQQLQQQHLLGHSSSLESINSVMSMYSAEGSKGDYFISGKVELGVWHKGEMLFVRVVKVQGLAAAKGGKASDPYVKTYLLPDRSKHTKRKTGVQRKTIDPEYNEILKVGVCEVT